MSDPLFNLALTTCIVGLLLLSYAGQTLTPAKIRLKDISIEDVGKNILVSADVSEIHQFEGGSILLTITGDNSSMKTYIPYHVSKEIKIDIEEIENCTLEILGELQTYQGELELVVADIEDIKIEKC
ncbi:MAG: hypothetical protein ABH950_06945 [Candidatus Altiarchaeota archaeon]